MKKLLYLLVGMLISFTAIAKDEDPEKYHVQGFLADGSMIEGYNKTMFQNFLRPWVTEVKISKEFGAKPDKYTSDDLKVVWFTDSATASPVIYHAVKAQKSLPNLWNKNPKPYKKPVYLRLIYDGENVKGYVRPVADFTHTPSMSVSTYTYVFYYMTKDSDVAVAFWCETGDIVPAMKKVMKFYLREFPELVRMVDEGEIKAEEFRFHTARMYPLMDRAWTPKAD